MFYSTVELFLTYLLQYFRLLSLSFCTSLTDAALLSISRCRKLKYLQLRKGEHFTNKALLSYLEDMEEAQSLRFKHLSLAECTEISDECLQVIGKKLVKVFLFLIEKSCNIFCSNKHM